MLCSLKALRCNNVNDTLYYIRYTVTVVNVVCVFSVSQTADDTYKLHLKITIVVQITHMKSACPFSQYCTLVYF